MITYPHSDPDGCGHLVFDGLQQRSVNHSCFEPTIVLTNFTEACRRWHQQILVFGCRPS